MKRFLPCLLIVLPLSASCAYQWGFPKPDGVNSVAIEIFQNNTFRRGVELSLSENISNEIVERTALQLTHLSQADAILRGKINQIQDQLILAGPNNEARYASVWVDLSAELVDRKTGKTLRQITIRDKGDYLTDNLQTRETATAQALTRLAEKIVLALCLKQEDGGKK